MTTKKDNYKYADKVVGVLAQALFAVKTASDDLRPDEIDERLKNLYYRLNDLVNDANKVKLDLMAEGSPWKK